MDGKVISILGISILFLITLPYWLPPLVVKLRIFLFTKVNGEEGISIPSDRINASEFRRIYSNKSASGRSEGANLSNLFWYWLSPGAEMHQEHIENGEEYNQIASVTKAVLSISNQEIETLLQKCGAPAFSETMIKSWKIIKLRDFIMPIWVRFFYELIFGESCSKEDEKIILKHSSNVVSALKCCALRDMPTRNVLTKFLIDKLNQGKFKYDFPGNFSVEEKALYLQGVFFTTAIVQMSDAMVHTFLALSKRIDIQKDLVQNKDNARLYDNVITETLRLYPLFGIAHRITKDAIQVDDQNVKEGSVLCFNYPKYHRIGYDNPDEFIPERWNTISKGKSNYMPFGIGTNRSCPASNFSLILMKKTMSIGLNQFTFHSSVEHTRSLPNRGSCILVSKKYKLTKGKRIALLSFLKIQDQWEKVYVSISQLLFGFIMILHARNLKLTTSYYQKERYNKQKITP
ncbi:cytochrome P450 [Aquimarina longa]|uniref:cytochrome P450 n=1 Tax=Aquimarina longa TaxID=1080221 RepID=UPI0007820F95|nr:cytochrome P450 [Aquimarina longa]